jgi:hypothetical protein
MLDPLGRPVDAAGQPIPETMPLPSCLSHLAQRDQAVRVRALEEALAVVTRTRASSATFAAEDALREMIERERAA